MVTLPRIRRAQFRTGAASMALLLTAMTVGLWADAGEPQPAPLPRGIEPRAEELVQEWCKRIQGIDQFAVEAEGTMDVLLPTGQKVQYGHHYSAAIDRPSKLTVDMSGDEINRTIWNDGKTITLLDKTANAYAQLKAPESTDAMIDALMADYGIDVPLADLLSGNPRDVLLSRSTHGVYMGLHAINGRDCHHVAFRQDNIDWQMWLDAGETLSLRKMIITYKLEPGQPQYALTIVNETANDLQAETFEFTPPDGAEQMTLDRVQKEGGGQ